MTASRWVKYLVSVVVGNILYFSFLPHLPPAARHHSNQPDVGIIVDLWFCLLVYGILELGVTAWNRRRKG
jgi:hypothetical protein